jgi:peptidoglycan/xylan/chitin deacetylase (PgdA/CDA1 family)
MAQFDPFNLVVTPEEFECQLIKLRTKTVLPLRVFARLHVEKKLPRHAVAITFDDGYACNALTAAPMLERFGYPATFFIMSDAIERSPPILRCGKTFAIFQLTSVASILLAFVAE